MLLKRQSKKHEGIRELLTVQEMQQRGVPMPVYESDTGDPAAALEAAPLSQAPWAADSVQAALLQNLTPGPDRHGPTFQKRALLP